VSAVMATYRLSSGYAFAAGTIAAITTTVP
jgi:hypothetical protein